MKRQLASAALFALVVGCGYRSVYAAPSGRMSVRPVVSNVADLATALEVEHGVREALAREGALATGAECPCVVVEVTRIDHAAGAIVAAGDRPVAASQITAVVARATVDDGQAHTLFDTGDVRAEGAYVASAASPRFSEALRGQDGTRSAGRRLGRLLGARLLGHPSASEENEGP